MKKVGVLNSEIAAVIASMGHLDTLTIVDLGYPVPSAARKVDLVVERGEPDIFKVLAVVLGELKVERAIIASEASAEFEEKVKELVGVDVDRLPHAEFKEFARQSKLFVRTGTAKPYHNVILVSGVTF